MGEAPASIDLGRFAVALAAAVASLFATATAAGQSLEEVTQDAFERESKHRGLALLARIGAEPAGYRVVERTPRTGDYLVEMAWRWEGRTFRMPLKVQNRRGWPVGWVASATYVKRLVQFTDSTSFVSMPSGDSPTWANRGGMPALPIVFDDRAATTPFGKFPLPETDAIEPPSTLGEHIGDWVRRQLEDDRGAAAVDLVPSRTARWSDLTRIVFGVAGAGLFRLHFVLQPEKRGELTTWTASAPVGTADRPMQRQNAMVVGLYEESDGRREIRVSVTGERISALGDANCGPKATLCAGSPEAFHEKLQNLVDEEFSERAPSVSHVMFASVGSVRVGEALRFARHVPPILGIPSRKLMLGHIGEAGGAGGSR